MYRAFVFLIVAALTLFAEPFVLPHSRSMDDFPVQWFEQVVDHFDGADTRTFKQRFWVNDLYFKDKSSPVILYISGEGECHGPPTVETNAEPALLAQKFGALLLTLEHRYYGESVPFTSLETENMVYLSSKQAIFDLAYFRSQYQEKNLPGSNNPWLIIGGSYSGALSAWSRIKFPHLYVGAVSSSGVVNAILDFVEFDEQIAESAGDECAEAMRATRAAVEGFYDDDPNKCLSMFQADGMQEGDFFYLQADTFSLPVQYGYQDDICVPLVTAYQKGGDLVSVFANFTINWFYPNFSPEGAKTYSTEFQQDTSVLASHNERQWWFQKCSELAYFQNAPSSGSIRSSRVNMTYHRDHCKQVFGMDLFPDTESTNIYYGGANPKGTNIFYANGSQDPWQRASVPQTLDPTQPEMTIKCHKCGHCVDLRGCPGGCPGDSFQKARDLIAAYVANWLADAGYE